MTTAVPAAGELTVRAPVADDLPVVFDLVTESDVLEFGEPDYAYDEFAEDWRSTDLDSNACVVVLADGRIVGWTTIQEEGQHTSLHFDGYVHPRHEGIGVGGALVRWAEARAAEHVPLAPEGVRVVLQTGFNARNERANAFFRSLDYDEVRRFWRMEIELDPENPPPAPAWPNDIVVRAVADEAEERRLHATVDEAFREHWGYVPKTSEAWAAFNKRHGFDPGLWLMALDGDEVAGALVGVVFPDSGGWVRHVAVRRPWRRRGLAEALLRESFRRFAERGHAKVALGVDATNPTGATRLYEKAEMAVTREFVFYEKELRPGVAPAPEDE